MAINFTLNEIMNHLGQLTKTEGGHSYFQCPYCMDSGKDNLVYTHKNGLLTCFANSDHSKQVLSNIAKVNKQNRGTNKPNPMPKTAQEYKDKNQPKKKTTPSITDDYILDCCMELLNDSTSKAFLKKHRGIKEGTIKLGMGINKQNKCWVFPAIDFNTGELFGAEYRTSYMIMPKELRPKGHKGLSKAPGTDSRLCSVFTSGITYENGQRIDLTQGSKKLLICEGFIDSYTIFQYLIEAGETYTYDIATPSNGVGTIKNLLNTIPVQKYSEIMFWLDNDDAGDQARQDIKKLASFDFVFKKVDCACCKDVNEWYMKHIRSK